MNGEASARVRRISDAGRPEAEASPRVVSVFRRHDDTICHGRCERPLVLKGVRAMLEADFYCFTCLIHVTRRETADGLATTIAAASCCRL